MKRSREPKRESKSCDGRLLKRWKPTLTNGFTQGSADLKDIQGRLFVFNKIEKDLQNYKSILEELERKKAHYQQWFDECEQEKQAFQTEAYERDRTRSPDKALVLNEDQFRSTQPYNQWIQTANSLVDSWMSSGSRIPPNLKVIINCARDNLEFMEVMADRGYAFLRQMLERKELVFYNVTWNPGRCSYTMINTNANTFGFVFTKRTSNEIAISWTFSDTTATEMFRLRLDKLELHICPETCARVRDFLQIPWDSSVSTHDIVFAFMPRDYETVFLKEVTRRLSMIKRTQTTANKRRVPNYFFECFSYCDSMDLFVDDVRRPWSRENLTFILPGDRLRMYRRWWTGGVGIGSNAIPISDLHALVESYIGKGLC